jgi:hypothetical protein
MCVVFYLHFFIRLVFLCGRFFGKIFIFQKNRMPDRITGLCGMMGFYLEPAEENT